VDAPPIERLLSQLQPIAAMATLAIAPTIVILTLRQGHTPAWRAALTPSSLLVLPFLILEFVNRRRFDEAFPIPLFSILWLLPLSFVVTLTPIVGMARGEAGARPASTSVVFRIVFLLFVAWLWVGLTLDQMPCFLGVPSCD
jgi:hypothetical protein